MAKIKGASLAYPHQQVISTGDKYKGLFKSLNYNYL